MKTLLTIAFLITTTQSFAQSIFPGLSPKGRIEQTIGNTNITVDYERPAARGRKVFGELIRYNNLWRTGAGNCTKITFDKAVTINNKTINKGTYSLFTIPNTNEWTVILNTDTTLYGTSGYDEKKDVIRFKVKAKSTDRHYESLTIDIDVVPNNAVIYIAWEKTQISLPVETESDKVVNDFVQQNLLTDKSTDPDEYATAAEYYFYLDKNLDWAIILVDKAIKMKNDAWYYRQKVDILEKQMKYPEAIDCANLAISLNQQRSDWDLKAKEQSEAQYKKRIEFFRSKVKK
ncbi:DUF2911 domain-containing protein [Chitinophaga sp. YR627]|uniref:DUF2911 domain-containing protein n=1 Tax=Chitinophaga sp. YR627 TaxID=1881041 RepID=UPI0015A7018F|nr:DUF2911 domain-containing protein [Chitinophaga sp. YR627]